MIEIAIVAVFIIVFILWLCVESLGSAQREKHIRAIKSHQAFLEDYQRWIDRHAAAQQELLERVERFKATMSGGA